MKIVRTVKEMQDLASRLIASGQSIGFVPTMGYLHAGHASLMTHARAENDVVVASVFVNPLQFGPNEDLDRYPRDLARDEAVCVDEGVDYLFYPSVEEMYPAGKRTTALDVVSRTDALCGTSRPGHFAGVVTVVLKLLNIVRPTRAYFGMKDAQQVAVLSGLVDDYNVPVEIVRVATVREDDGLALSSRNVFLSDDERSDATILSRTLRYGADLLLGGKHTPSEVEAACRTFIAEHSSLARVDYVQVRTYPALEETNVCEGELILALALHYAHARLIDNTIVVCGENGGE
ncbi:MAG: pantoate--beta-alanine ligase [Bacilli bacterium]